MGRIAKKLNQPEIGQKKITSFFARQKQNNPPTPAASSDNGQQKITEFLVPKNRTSKEVVALDTSPEDDGEFLRKRAKRRKVGRCTPANPNQVVQLVDITDSDEERIIFVPSPQKKEGSVSCRKENMPSYVRVEEYQEADKVGTVPFSSKSEPVEVMETQEDVISVEMEHMELSTGRQLETERGRVPTVLGEEQERGSSSCEGEEKIGEGNEDCNFGLIQIRPIKQILDDSQDSCATANTSSCSILEEETVDFTELNTQVISPATSNSLNSGVRNMFLSPAKISRHSSSSSLGSATKTPMKSPKTRITKFSPIRALQKKTPSKSLFSPDKSSQRSGSTTPIKNLFSSTQSPGKIGTSSPLKTLFSAKSVPYFLKNFLDVIGAVVEDTAHKHLLSDEDLEIVRKFKNLSRPSQCLLVRLMGRKWKWNRASSIKYPEIANDMNPVLESLHSSGFLNEIRDAKIPLEELLDILDADALLPLAKKMGVKYKQKDAIKKELLKRSVSQSTLRGSMEDVIYDSALKEVGLAYKLALEPKQVFARMFMLYIPPQYWEQEEDKDSLQLLSILLSDMGKIQYPSYRIIRRHPIYSHRDELIGFHEAWQLHCRMNGFILNKMWADGVEVGTTAFSHLKTNIQKSEMIADHLQMPYFLRAYVPGSILARVTWMGIDCLQKQRNYELAVEILEFLLGQNVYLLHYRGRWYERLILNSKHLKRNNQEILQTIRNALNDDAVKENYKLEFTERYDKLRQFVATQKDKEDQKRKPPRKRKKRNAPAVSKRRKYVDTTSESSSDSEIEVEGDVTNVVSESMEDCPKYYLSHDVRKVTIEGEKMPMFDREHGKSVFLGRSSDGHSLSSVEEYAISHYKTQGFTYSVHSEGSAPCSIFGLIFWDIIYEMEIPDVFRNAYQALPLDLMFPDFYLNRKNAVDDLIYNLEREWSCEKLLEMMESTWNDHNGRLSVVSWELFQSFEPMKTLVQSMGMKVIAGICSRLAKDYRHYRSGFPDLVVWNGSKCCFVEVKGPGDKLSSKQRIWLDYLKSINAEVEICYVKAVSNKRLRI